MTSIRWTASTYAAALAALCLAAAPAAAQDGTVRGQVIDTRSGQPVAHAAVHVDDERTTAVADAQGRFELRHLRPGTRAFWADAPGYSMEIGMIEVPAGTLELTLQMQGDPVRLATLEVTTSRFDRRAAGYPGTVRVFRQDDLWNTSASNLNELLQTRVGVRPTLCPGYSSYGRLSCVYARGGASSSLVYVDEAPWIGGLAGLAAYHPTEVARLEVYAGGREIHVFTRQFMEQAAERAYVPEPLGLALLAGR